MVRKAKISDTAAIAHIHFLQLNSDFLSSLGKNFLKFLYRIFIKNKEITVLVYEEKEEILGFITGAKDFDKEFKQIIIRNFLTFFLILIPTIIKNPSILKKIIKTFFYTSRQPHIGISAELISIAVDGKHQGKGIGKRLTKSLENEFKSNKIYTYKVSTNKNNKNANYFYRSLNFIKKGEYITYEKKVNLYIKELK